jgi:hypothetical protein
LNLNSWYGAEMTPPQFRRKTRENLYADPTYALIDSRLGTGRYAVQVSYIIGGEQNHWRAPVQLQSDTLFFNVSGVAGTWEDSVLAGYARAVDSAMAVPRPTMSGVASQWLPRFSNSRLFVDVFMDAGVHGDSIPRDRLFAWMDPFERRSTSRAMLLDLLFFLSAHDRMVDPSALSSFARGDLAQRVIQDWKARPRRWSFRDSVYAERKKYLIRGHPPYGTWVEPNNATEPPAGE